MVEMERIEKILSDPQYRFYCEKNQKWEQSRVFCKHDMEHFWQTARVAYILYLESKDEDDKLPGGKVKEMLYAAALLHDIGRFKEYEDKTLDHASESAILARPLLDSAGFCSEEIAQILEAIKNHREPGHPGLSRLIYQADKESRPCCTCPALDDCKKFSATKRPQVRY